jgi:hypothetical protein
MFAQTFAHTLIGLALLVICDAAVLAQSASETGAASAADEGLVFDCPATVLDTLAPAVQTYLSALGVNPELVASKRSAGSGALVLSLAAGLADRNTLDLIDRDTLDLSEEQIALPAAQGQKKWVTTVSRREIAYALLQTGRANVFSGRACSLEALQDQIGIRQNIVAWAESLEWQWPNGGPARWNARYWQRGDLRRGRRLNEAVNDAFIHNSRYSIGCYTATKLVIIQGVLDYYRRIKRDERTLALVERQLLQDGDPLTHIEPGALWSFESDSTDADRRRPGKLLSLLPDVASHNFVPGDWSYFLNTDPLTYQKTGYEGSNAVYLGRGKFDDYYNDHNHSYSFKEKLHEVYQWRHGVFSASRDVAKVKPLSARALTALGATPQANGLLLDVRTVPLYFGFQDLPRLQ